MPTFNGITYSHQSLNIIIPGLGLQPLKGVKSLNYKAQNNTSKQYGNQQFMLSETLGTIECSGSIEMYVEDFVRLTAAMGHGWSEKYVTIILNYSIDGVATHTVELVNVRFVNPDSGTTEGTDAQTYKMDLSIQEIRHPAVMSYGNSTQSLNSSVRISGSVEVAVQSFAFRPTELDMLF